MTVDTTEVVKMIRNGDKSGMLAYLKKGGDPNARNHMCWTLLHLASFEGQKEIAEILLDGGATVNSCTTDMSTPLHRACAQGNKPVVEVLVKKGAYINAQDKNGNTPLHEAARGFHTSCVKILLEKKADKTKMNRKKQTFLNLIGQQLMPSVESGDCEVLQQWLEWGASPDTKGNLHWSILHHACARGQLNIASLLIERGADVNIEDSNKTTPLHTACFNGHLRIASLLIESKANLDAQDQRGNTPLHSAISGGHPDLVNLLLENGCDTTIANKEGQYFTHLVNEFLVNAVQGSKVAQVISLIKGRANPNTRDRYGYTVLCQAAFKGDFLVADALLEGGADPNLTDMNQGKTPLHYASAWGHLFVVKSLLDKGASVNVKDKVGATPLHEAARDGYEDVITVLIGRGANFNETDVDGNTPLHIAGKWGQTSTVELLLEKNAKDSIRNKSNLLYSDLALIRAVRTADKNQVVSGMAWGGDPNSRDPRGWTLLHHAVYKGVEEICVLLLENGANVNAVDLHGRTPLLLAAYRGNQQIMQILIDAGADINAQDWMGRTPLHWAANEGSIDTVQMLLDHKANTTIKNKDGILYSNLLLKHLYFAVRHNDAEQVVRLVTAGADQYAEVEGTGVSSREEAIRRGFYDILRQMASLVQKKPRQEDDKIIALEDVHRLFDDAIITEDGDFTTPEEGQEECEEQEEGEDEAEERDESVEDDYEDGDAYWKMSNAYEVLTVEEAFGEEDYGWLKEFEEKPKVISAKELLEEEQAAFWDTWQEKQKVISAKEFFKEKTDWWEDEDEDENEDKNEDEDSSEVMSNNDFSRDDECWWRDAQETLDKPKPVSAKEYFREEKPWWEKENNEQETKDGSPKEYFTHDTPWWKTEEHKANVISSKEFFKDDDKPWWQEEKVSAKEYFQEEKPWWQEEDNEKMISAKEYFKEEVPWWQEDSKLVSAKEFFKDEELPWWYTEDMHPEKSDVLKKSLATARFFERYPPTKRFCGEEESVEAENENVLSDDEIEESTRTDDYEDATDSLVSDSSTMYSASEGERSQASTTKDIPWWEDNATQGRKHDQGIPKAADFFRDKHWLDDASETSEPTETLDMDTSEISEIVTEGDTPKSAPWVQSTDDKNKKGAGSDESEMDEEEDELEDEEESGEIDGEEEDIDDEMGDEESDSESEELQSEDEIEDIIDEELGEEINTYDTIKEKANMSIMVGQKGTDDIISSENKLHEAQKEINIPSIVLHEIGNDNGNNKLRTHNVKERRNRKTTEESSHVDIVPEVVSNSYDTLEKENTNVDVGITNTGSPIDPSHYSISVHDIAGNLQKSDSQTSGYDSSLSLSDSKARDVSKDSGCEGLMVDECVEDTDISEITNTLGTELGEGLEDSCCHIQDECDPVNSTLNDMQDECDPVNSSVNDIHLIAKALGEVREQDKTSDANKSQFGVTETDIVKKSVEKDCNTQVIIQMKWDTTEDSSSSLPQAQHSDENLETPDSMKINNQPQINTTEESLLSTETKQIQESIPREKDYNTTYGNEQESTKQEIKCNQTEAKTYAAVVKTNFEKPTVNKMDDCLARLDASLAWVDARLSKESEERASNENLKEKSNSDKMLTYAGAVKKGTSLSVTENKPKPHCVDGGRLSGNDLKREDKETIQFMKVHVHVPEEESSRDQEHHSSSSECGYEKHRFAGGSLPKKNDSKDSDSNKNTKCTSQLPHILSSIDTNNHDLPVSSTTKEASVQEEKSGTCPEFESKELPNSHKAYSSNESVLTEDELKDKIVVTEEITASVQSEISGCVDTGQKENICYHKDNIHMPDDNENTETSDIMGARSKTSPEKVTETPYSSTVKENLSFTEDQVNVLAPESSEAIAKEKISMDEVTNEQLGTTQNISEEITEEKKESPKEKELSRESSIDRLSPHRESEPSSLYTDKTLWRCSTYDALSISDYDNLAFMIQKSSSSPACWGSKRKRKEHSINNETLDQAKDILKQDPSSNSHNDQDDSVPLDTIKVSNEGALPNEAQGMGLYSDEGTESTNKTESSSVDPCGTKDSVSSDIHSEGNLPHKYVPEASSVLLPEAPEALEAEACTNLRDTSCNQDPPVAPRRTKEHSLKSQKLKYKVADHSGHTQPSHSLKQPTNTTLYDPDKKETSKVEAAVNVRPDEPRVQEVSTKRNKEGRKDKEKQKELAVATGKIDPVRKSSSCSVS